MHKIVQQITVWLMVVNLLVATMGMTVHSLYCICKDNLSLSVFEMETHCNKSSDEKMPSCCASSLAEKKCSKDHDCESKDAKYVKLTTQFVINEVGLDISMPDFQITKNDFIINNDKVVTKVNGARLNKPPPLLPYGKALLPHIQSFLC